jgi:hypothetical protein
MTRTRWWWGSLAGLFMLAGVLGGCDGDDHDEEPHAHDRCLLFREREPNDSTLLAQILDLGFAGDCVIVEGTLFAATDVDTYAILVEETLTLVVTVDHSPGVDFDVQLFNAETGDLLRDCGLGVVPEVCVVSFVVGAGPYTLTLDVQ